jgi:hypothetical protein
MRQGQRDKDSRNPPSSWNSFSSLKISILLLILFLGCGQSENKIEGTWTYIKEVDNGKEIRSAALAENQVQYLENGEMQLFHNNKRYGLAIYHYELKGDSLRLINIEVDKTGSIDIWEH